MTFKVNIKQIGSKRNKICEKDFYIDKEPENVREFIISAVHTCVLEYNIRVNLKENTKILSEEDISQMSDIGKIAFGINYNGKEADELKAIENALQAYEDGLFRIFIGDNEVGELSDKIKLSENDSVTFIRLTMLTGRLW